MAINVKEIQQPSLSAQVVAQQIVADIEKRQSRGDFILQKPIITIRPTSIEPIKEWNRNSAMKILIDKQLYKNPTTKEVSAIPKNRDFSYGQLSVPVYEYTYMKYPTHFMRGYKLNIWSDYIEDQNRILETVITGLISSNTIIIENDNYKTFGYVRSIQDDSNYDNRDEETRMIKNYIELEFEGYLTNLKNIIKVRNASHFKITETLLKNN